ncbi:MAG: MCE family protein, partial [Ignavibacteriae bacterium]|nr:MCE family protein [Ignavibacteriota bacterium]
MTSEKKTEVKVGVTVFVALLVLAVIFGWAKNFSLSQSNEFISVKFPTVAGLEIADMVSVNGVRKGLVNSISSDGNFAKVEIKFGEDVQLKEDATFSIMMLDLMGGKKIEINAGNSNNEIDFAKVHVGKFAGDVSTSMEMLSSVQTDLVDVIKEVKYSLVNINKFFADPTFSKDISSSVNSMKKLTNNLDELIVENRQMIKETISNTNKLTKTANSVLDDNQNNIKLAIEKLNSTLNSSSELITKFNTLSDEIANKENNIGKLIYDEELIGDLKTSF